MFFPTQQQGRFGTCPHPTSLQVNTLTEETIKEVVITSTEFHIASTWLQFEHISPNYCKDNGRETQIPNTTPQQQ
jgi:hypothetical protein